MTSIAILVEGTEDVRISRNRVRRCGNRDDLGLGYTAGIVAAAVGPLAIESCELTDIGRGVAGVAAGETYGIRAITRRATVRDNQVTLSPELAPANVQMALQVTGLDWLDVTGNVLSARGPRRLVALRAVYSELPLDVIFSNNRCVHAQPNTAPAHPESTVLLQLIRRLTAMGNHVTGTPRAQVSLDFQASAALIAAGNITSGTVANLPANRRPANYADLNMITT
jgi:hypothetical protein